jgi:hypothetical protein
MGIYLKPSAGGLLYYCARTGRRVDGPGGEAKINNNKFHYNPVSLPVQTSFNQIDPGFDESGTIQTDSK